MDKQTLDKNASAIEKAKWLIECWKYYQLGGRIQIHSTGLICQMQTTRRIYRWDRDPEEYIMIYKPKYRPFNTVNEVPVGRVLIHKDNESKRLIAYAEYYTDEDIGRCIRIFLLGVGSVTAEDLLEDYTFTDGAPCGMKLQDSDK